MNEKFYNEIKNILYRARNKVYKTANFVMVETYWNIGKSIIEEQGGNEKAEYGAGLLKELSKQMTQDFASAGDIRLKGKVMKNLLIISKINLKQKCSAVRKKEVGQLCSIYAATMLKMMKEAYIPDFEGWKKEVMERKTAVWSKEFNARWESFLKERDERVERKKKELSIPFEQRMRRQKTEEERIRDREFGEKDAAFMQEAREKWNKRMNLDVSLSMMDGRNSKIKSFLKDKGGSLLRILLDNYPGKATEVFKYLKLAGYEEGEMMEFIDREMGKNKDTEFLYQSSLGRKFLKEKKE